MTTERCDLVTVAALTLRADDSSRHLYPGILNLPGQRLLLVDFSLNNVRLYNLRTGDLLSKSEELYPLWDVCSIDENKSKIAVSLRNGTIQTLCIIGNEPSPYIKKLNEFKTPLDSCRGVTYIPKKETLVVCGMLRKMQCWCVLSISNGKVGKQHEICENGGFGCSYVAASENGKRVYISCFADKAIDTGVYGYVLETGEITFIYRRKDLSWPRGICTDKRGLIYVCNQHIDSRNIHQLTENGEPVMIFRLELPPDPQGMCLDKNEEQIFMTFWGKDQLSSLRLVWRNQAETALSNTRVRTRDRIMKKERETEAIQWSGHDTKAFAPTEQSSSEGITLGCFGCFARRVSKNKETNKHNKKMYHNDVKEFAHCIWNDEEVKIHSEKDSQTSSESEDHSPHGTKIDTNRPISLDEDVTPGKIPNQSSSDINEVPQGAKNEILDTPKQRHRHRKQESIDSETESLNEGSSSSRASTDSQGGTKCDVSKDRKACKKSATNIIGPNNGIVSIVGRRTGKVVQINFFTEGKFNNEKEQEKGKEF